MNRVVAAARGWIGTPYRHGASCRSVGADCLGLVRGIWRELYGAEPEPVPPYGPEWSEAGGEERLWAVALRHLAPARGAAVRAGDLLLFRMRAGAVAKHLGVATGAGRFIHAYSGHGVVDSALTAAWARRVVARFEFPGEG